MPPNQEANAAKKGGGKKGVKRPLYLGLLIMGDDGQPMKIDKSRIKIEYTTRDTRSVVEKIEANSNIINVKTEV